MTAHPGAGPPGRQVPPAAPHPAAEHLLFVCTGNVCRSPYMEIVVRHALDGPAPAVRVSSAGTAALEGHVLAEPMRDILRRRGLESEDFRARQLTSSMLTRATLIVTAERDHRRWVMRLDPSAVTRTFTLLQVARLLGVAGMTDAADPVAPIARLRARLERARGAGGSASREDDIPDPWRGPRRGYRRATATMDRALHSLVAELTTTAPAA